MKKVFIPIIALLILGGVSSCAKCVTCKKNDQWQKVCDKDNTKQDVSDAVDFYETLGWDCKASTGVY